MVTSGGGLSDPKMMVMAVAGVMVLAGGGAFAVSGLFAPKTAAAATSGPPPAEVALSRNAELATVFQVVKEKFPADYPELQKRTTDLLARNDIPGAAWATFRLTDAITERDAPGNLERAESAKLGEFMRRAVEFLLAVQAKSPDLCAKVALGQMNDEGLRTLLSDAGVLNAAAREETATLIAIDNGRTRPQRYPAPARDELEMMGRAVVQQGLKIGDAMSYRSAGLNGMTPKKRCALLVKSFRAIRGLPEPARSRFIAQAAASATVKVQNAKPTED